MDEEFESFIVDPDLVDPELDISGLRTATDTRPELLFDLPEFSGIRVDPTRRSYVEDMYRAYAGQIPMLDIDTPAAAPPDTGGGGGEDPGNEGITIPVTPVRPINPNPIPPAGGGADMGTVPVTRPPVDNTITIEPLNPVGELDDYLGLEEYNEALAAAGGMTEPKIIKPVTPTQDLPMVQTPLDVPTTEVLGTGVMPAFGDMPTDFTLGPAYTGEFDPDDEGTVFDTSELTDATPEQRNTIQNILAAAGDNVQGALTELGKIPGAVVDKFNKTVDVFGKKLNVGKTLASIAINKAVGAPVSLVFGLLPEGGISTTTNKAREVGLLTGDSTVTQDIYGINTQSQFGDYNQYNVDQVENLNDALTNLETKYDATWNEEQGVFIDKKTGLPDKKANDMTTRMRTELKKRKDYVKTSGADGDIDERDQMLEDIVLQNKIDEGIQAADDDKGDDMLDTFDTTPITTDITSDLIDEVALTGGGDGGDGGGGVAPSTPSFDPGQGFVDQGGEGEFGSAPSKPTTGVNPFADIDTDLDAYSDGGGDGGGGGQDKGGCVIATHAVNSGAFTKDTKREAVRWCVKNLHRTWWGEAIRRGYRYYGQKAIEEGKAKNHYQEFKDYVAFGTGKRRTLKTGWTFIYRSIQFFIRGLINV